MSNIFKFTSSSIAEEFGSCCTAVPGGVLCDLPYASTCNDQQERHFPQIEHFLNFYYLSSVSLLV